MGKENDNISDDIIGIIDNALALAGYKILDGGSDKDYEYLVIRHSKSDTDYEVRLTELTS